MIYTAGCGKRTKLLVERPATVLLLVASWQLGCNSGAELLGLVKEIIQMPAFSSC